MSGITIIDNNSNSVITLNNPQFTIEDVNYNCQSGIAKLALHFNELGGIYKTERIFSLPVGEVENLGKIEIIAAIGQIFSSATYVIQ